MKVLAQIGAFIVGTIIAMALFNARTVGDVLKSAVFGGGVAVTVVGALFRSDGSTTSSTQSAGLGSASAALRLLEEQDNSSALAKAQSIIGGLEKDAVQQQLQLASAPSLPVGMVSQTESATIRANSALNDVATGYYVKGRALEQAGKLEEAREAYLKATSFSQGRVQDGLTGYWSPAEAARSRLRELFGDAVTGEVDRASAQLQQDAPDPNRPRILPGAKAGAWVCSVCGGFVRKDALLCKHCKVHFQA